MLHPSLSHLLVEARVEELHRAARNDGRSRRLSGREGEVDRSPAEALASRVTRSIARLFSGGRSADDEGAATASF